MKSKIITMSGCSAAGKSFFVEKIVSTFSNVKEITGVTTRAKRDGEVDGISSYFLTLEEFNNLDCDGEFEFVKEIFGNKYAWYKRDLINGIDPKIMNISYNTIESLRKLDIDLHAIFIKPYSEEKLKEILKARLLPGNEYKKRLDDYYESENFIQKSSRSFDAIFENQYDDLSCEKIVAYLKSQVFSKGKKLKL